MKLFSKGAKSLLSFFCLLAAILCFSYAAEAQTVGSTGAPFLDWETEKVCYSPAVGDDVTLNKFTLAGDGQTQPLVQSTRYFTASNVEVFPDTTTGTLVFGMCGGVDVNADSIMLFVEEVKYCDYNELRVQPYHSFIRSYLRSVNINTNKISTLGFEDFDYTGAEYDPEGIIGEGLCAALDTLPGVIDYEYIRVCMLDSIGVNNMVEYTKLWVIKDTVITFINVDDSFEPYPLAGATQKKCSDNEVLAIERLCDVDQRTVSLDMTATYEGNNVISYFRTTSQIDLLPVTNYTIDCGQGERFTGRQFLDCYCDYSNVPDGEYYVTISLDFTNGGTATDVADSYQIRDGRMFQGINNVLLSGTRNIGVGGYIDVNFFTTPFFRKFYKDGTTQDVKLDGTPHTVTGIAEENCLNDGLYYTQTFEPSTRPAVNIIGDECREITIPSGGNNWEITGTFLDVSGNPVNGISSLTDIKFNGATIPLNYQYNLSGLFDEDDFINDLQNHMIDNNITFGSVSFDEGIITINALDPAITSVTSASTGINTTSTPYTGDTSLLFRVYRNAENGKEVITINPYGNETRLRKDAINIDCSGGNNEEVDDCDELLRETHTFEFTDTLVTIPANTVYAYDIRPQIGNPLVTKGTDPTFAYPTNYGNNFNLPRCFKVSNDVVIDTRNGSTAIVSWIK